MQIIDYNVEVYRALGVEILRGSINGDSKVRSGGDAGVINKCEWV